MRNDIKYQPGVPLHEQFAKALAPKYTISWTTNVRHCQRWLHMTEEGSALLVRNADKATKFSRDDCNTILLALYNAGRWSEGGAGSFPCLHEVR